MSITISPSTRNKLFYRLYSSSYAEGFLSFDRDHTGLVTVLNPDIAEWCEANLAAVPLPFHDGHQMLSDGPAANYLIFKNEDDMSLFHMKFSERNTPRR